MPIYTLNPRCEIYQGYGNWTNELMFSGNYKLPMVSIENPDILSQREEGRTLRKVIDAGVITLAIGLAGMGLLGMINHKQEVKETPRYELRRINPELFEQTPGSKKGQNFFNQPRNFNPQKIEEKRVMV